MEDQKFQQILEYFDLSFSGYRKVRKSVKKRINRHMQKLGCRTISDYLSILNENDNQLKEASRLMTVSISRFFRDHHMWHILEHEIFPLLIQHQHIHIWSASCACGEEVYSVNILKDRLKQAYSDFPEIHISGTDMNPVYIQKAQIGVYPASSLREIPEPWQDLYFEKYEKKRKFAVQEHLKKNIFWEVRSFDTMPSMQYANIIFLRNSLLTYYKSHIQKETLKTILDALVPSGWLVIGSRESLPGEYPDLKVHPSCAFIYEKSA
jgi:chemotaxis protein methyltransferase CheR